LNANDEARMTNDERMTKSEAQKPVGADDFCLEKGFSRKYRNMPKGRELKLQARKL